MTLSATGGDGYNYAITVDGAPLYAGTNPSFSWNTAAVANGSRTLSATVTDSQSRSASASRTVNVSNGTTSPPTPPTPPPPPPPSGGADFAVSFSYPSTGAPVNGVQSVGLSTTAAWGQAKTIAISVDGTVITSQSVTGTTLWHSWDTTGVADGTRTLTASVTMNGQTATATLPVTIANRSVSLSLAVGSSGQRSGEQSPLTVTIANPGGAVSGDVYIGVGLPAAAGAGLGCPNGDAVGFVTAGSSSLTVRCASASPATFPRFAAGTTIPAGLGATTPTNLAIAWPPTAGGAHVVFIALTVPGALADGNVGPNDVLAVDSRTVTVMP